MVFHFYLQDTPKTDQFLKSWSGSVVSVTIWKEDPQCYWKFCQVIHLLTMSLENHLQWMVCVCVCDVLLHGLLLKMLSSLYLFLFHFCFSTHAQILDVNPMGTLISFIHLTLSTQYTKDPNMKKTQLHINILIVLPIRKLPPLIHSPILACEACSCPHVADSLWGQL